MSTLTKAVSFFQNITPYWLEEASIKEISQLPPEKLYELQNDIKKEIGIHEARLAALLEGVALKYSQEFVNERKAKGGDFGLVRVEHLGYQAEQTIPKNVSWDQDGMKVIEMELEEQWDEDPTEYIETKRTVQEKKYSAWPTAIKKLFQPARTTKPGKVKIEIKRKESE